MSTEECIEVGEYHGGVYREIGECLRRSAMRLGIYTKEECIERLGSVQGEGNEMF